MKGQLISHHIKYYEIHGKDEVILMTKSEHAALHKQLRRTNKCVIPSNKLSLISYKARGRLSKRKKYNLNIGDKMNIDIIINYNPITDRISVQSCYRGFP